MPLNLVLARAPRPLPKDVTINISLTRAAARKSLITLKLNEAGNDAGSLDGSVPLPLINPTFRAKFFESAYYDRKLTPQRICRISYPYTERTVFRETLPTGQDNFKVKVSDGEFFVVLIRLMKK